MHTPESGTTFALIEHKNFSVKTYKQQFVKSFLEHSVHYTKPSFNRSSKLKTAAALYDNFFLRHNIDIAPSLERLNRYKKKEVSLDYFLSDLFFKFLSDYTHSLIGASNDWKHLNNIIKAIEAFLDECHHMTLSPSSTQETNDVIPDDVAITFLETLRRQSQKIRVLNTYHGIPIEFTAKIVHTSANKVLIKAHALQDIAATYQGGIYILCEEAFGYDLFAKVTPRVIKGHDLLELSQFDSLTSGIHKRQTVRVAPLSQTTVLINNYSTVLFDISLGGISMVCPRDLKLELYERVTVKVPDTLCGTVLHIEAELIHVSTFEDGYKYHFQLELNPSQESDLGKYIYQRQNEIISDLKEKLI